MDGSMIPRQDLLRSQSHLRSSAILLVMSDPDPRLLAMASRLRKVKEAYGTLVLCGKDDPFPELIRSKARAIAGPEGSNLLALVRIHPSGKGAYYRREANHALASAPEVVACIRQRFLGPEDRIEVSPTRNPRILRASGEQVRLEWHHSPNHIMTVSLITAEVHRLAWGLAALHVDGNRGGNEMFNVRYGMGGR